MRDLSSGRGIEHGSPVTSVEVRGDAEDSPKMASSIAHRISMSRARRVLQSERLSTKSDPRDHFGSWICQYIAVFLTLSFLSTAFQPPDLQDQRDEVVEDIIVGVSCSSYHHTWFAAFWATESLVETRSCTLLEESLLHTTPRLCRRIVMK